MSKRILVVEDTASIQEVLGWTLKAAGYEVIEALDGLEALKHMQTILPDLILLDIAMPGMDGFHFLEEVDRREMRSGIPIIGLTAYGKSENLTQLPVDAIIYKPFHIKPLLETVAHWLQSSSHETKPASETAARKTP